MEAREAKDVKDPLLQSVVEYVIAMDCFNFVVVESARRASLRLIRSRRALETLGGFDDVFVIFLI